MTENVWRTSSTQNSCSEQDHDLENLYQNCRLKLSPGNLHLINTTKIDLSKDQQKLKKTFRLFPTCSRFHSPHLGSSESTSARSLAEGVAGTEKGDDAHPEVVETSTDTVFPRFRHDVPESAQRRHEATEDQTEHGTKNAQASDLH